MECSLYYEERGHGIPLVLLHGNGEDGTYFVHQMAYFSTSYRVIAVDTRGHGKSPRGSAPFTMDQFADDLREFFDQRSIDRAIVLGFSDGANIAMKFALRFPERVRALILNGGNLNAGGVKRTVQIPVEIGYRIAVLFARRSAEAARKAEILGLMVHEPNIPAEALERITASTLVIAGDRDMIRDSHTRQIAGCIPQAQLAILPGDHFLANRRPEAFNRTVEEFLNRLEA